MTDRREEAVTVEEEEAVVAVEDEEDTWHPAMAGTVHETWVLFFPILPRQELEPFLTFCFCVFRQSPILHIQFSESPII